jgi:hypothetical protein
MSLSHIGVEITHLGEKPLSDEKLNIFIRKTIISLIDDSENYDLKGRSFVLDVCYQGEKYCAVVSLFNNEIRYGTSHIQSDNSLCNSFFLLAESNIKQHITSNYLKNMAKLNGLKSLLGKKGYSDA